MRRKKTRTLLLRSRIKDLPPDERALVMGFLHAKKLPSDSLFAACDATASALMELQRFLLGYAPVICAVRGQMKRAGAKAAFCDFALDDLSVIRRWLKSRTSLCPPEATRLLHERRLRPGLLWTIARQFKIRGSDAYRVRLGRAAEPLVMELLTRSIPMLLLREEAPDISGSIGELTIRAFMHALDSAVKPSHLGYFKLSVRDMAHSAALANPLGIQFSHSMQERIYALAEAENSACGDIPQTSDRDLKAARVAYRKLRSIRRLPATLCAPRLNDEKEREVTRMVEAFLSDLDTRTQELVSKYFGLGTGRRVLFRTLAEEYFISESRVAELVGHAVRSVRYSRKKFQRIVDSDPHQPPLGVLNLK